MPLYEFDKFEPHLYHLRTQPERQYEPFRNARRRAFLLWGEHCTECAAPDCYSTCELYQSRPDRRCRRFAFGMYANPAFPSGCGEGAEVVFKRWALLTARGNAAMMPSGLVRLLERVATVLSPSVNSSGRLFGNLFREPRFSYLTFALLERFNHWLLKRSRRARPDAFVFECYNPSSAAVVVQLHIAIERSKAPKSVAPDQLPPPFVCSFAIPPGYFRRDIAKECFEPILETALPFGLTIAPDADNGGAHLVFLALDFVSYDRPEAALTAPPGSPSAVRQPAAATDSRSNGDGSMVSVAELANSAAARPQAKCVVFDLDHTLWSGVLLEGDVQLKPGVVDVLRSLDSRGILLSVASKNSREHAQETLVAVGIEEYFLYPQINWGRKSDSIKSISKSIDIGLDTFIFIDDNPFDRDEVMQALPQVEVLDERSIACLLDHPRLAGSSTAEAKGRRQMYRRSMARSDSAKEFGEDYIGFLRSCQMRLTVRNPAADDLVRVSELAQRTNQLNFSGAKYKDADVMTILEDPGLEKYVLECSDRYGSYGIVGFCVVKRSSGIALVLELMLSCRVQGKCLEEALFHVLINREPFVQRLEVRFKKTPRNAPAQSALRKLGFDMSVDGVVGRDVQPDDFAVDFIDITAPGCGAREGHAIN